MSAENTPRRVPIRYLADIWPIQMFYGLKEGLNHVRVAIPVEFRVGASRRGAGDAARQGVSVTFRAYGYSCTTRAVSHGDRRAGRPARGARPPASVATLAALIRVGVERRARRIPSRRWA